MIRAVLFDLDGTLTDTLKDIADAMNRALALNGLPVYPVDAYRYMVGDGVKTLTRRAVADRLDRYDAVLNAYQSYYATHNQVCSKVYDGMAQTLEQLTAMGLRLCVFSNKPHADTQNVVRHYLPQIDFQVVRGQMEGVPVKPAPDGAIAVAGEMGYQPDEFLYCGDTGTDMQCACNAGMHPVGVTWGFREEQELWENGAEYVINHPAELAVLAASLIKEAE